MFKSLLFQVSSYPEATPGPTIEAARALEEVDLSLYPAPHIAGTSDLQHLVHQTVWQHRARLGVATNKLEPSIAFGDVFLRRDYPAPSQEQDLRDAFIVMTPACDLVREEGTKRILLLAGDVTPLTHTSWDYGNSLTTPLGRLEDGSGRHAPARSASNVSSSLLEKSVAPDRSTVDSALSLLALAKPGFVY